MLPQILGQFPFGKSCKKWPRSEQTLAEWVGSLLARMLQQNPRRADMDPQCWIQGRNHVFPEELPVSHLRMQIQAPL